VAPPGFAAVAVAGILLAASALVPGGTASAADPPLPSMAAQSEAIATEKASRTPAERKVESNLLFAVREHAGRAAVPGAPALRSQLPVGEVVEVDVDARIDGGLLDAVVALGGEVVSAHPRFDALRARLPIDAVLPLAARPEVEGVRPADRATTNRRQHAAAPASVGSGANEADATHLTAEARATFGVDGTGVLACVLSDGIDTLADRQATGDLPAIEVLPGQAGDGAEGTAMLELIHDLAPGADLAFATAFGGIAQFAQNIDDLVVLGCDVMVDDVTYFAEPTFQDGPIAQAITRARTAGVVYLSSAGNGGNLPDGTSGTWQGDFQDAGASAAPLPLGRRVHGWGVGAPTNPITLTGGPMNLQWADPLDASSNDYDLFLLNAAGTAIVGSSTNVQDGTQQPAESIASSPAGARVVVVKAAAASDRFLVVYTNRGQLAHATGGGARGHNVSADAISVAATPAGPPLVTGGPTGPFPGAHSAPDASETFSADGPVRQFFAPDGAPLTPGDLSATGGTTAGGPDVTAADGVTTTTPGFVRFYGTSAAAPNLAALVALGLEAVPDASPAQVEAALAAAAIDLEAPGPDPVTGAGVVLAPDLLGELGATPAARLVAGQQMATTPRGPTAAGIEPGDVVMVDQVLENVGVEAATGITATLSTTSPHLELIDAEVAYPDLAAGSSSGALAGSGPLAVQVAADCPCGQSLPLVLTVAYAGGQRPTTEIPIDLVVGRPQPSTSSAYAGPAVAIPDGSPSGAVATVQVPPRGRLTEVALTIGGSSCSTTVGSTTVGLDHSYVGDLTLSLTSPAGTTVTLLRERGGSANNLCQTTFADDGLRAAASLGDTDAPFTGRYRPEDPLAAFLGEDPTGTWTLRAVDATSSDTGRIRAFSLRVETVRCGDDTDPTRAYVAAVYDDLLGRAPDAGGLEFWAGRIERGTISRTTFTGQMARSNEYATKVVTRAYQDVLGRDPDPSGRIYWANRVGAGMAPSVLVLQLIASNEFLASTGGDVGGFVDAAYQAILDRAPDPAGRSFAVRQIEGGRTRLSVAQQLYASTESRRRRTRVQYDLLLQRQPTAAELTIWIGWLAQLTDIDLAVLLAASQEYYDAAISPPP
jgi:subtilisin-like proprotein convertase family protein